MKIAILQPNYIPWHGYFSLMKAVDKFVFLDDVQYTSRDWRNRNKIMINGKECWLTIPVEKNSTDLKINQVKVAKSDWILKHLKMIEFNYSKSAGKEMVKIMFQELEEKNYQYLSEINIWLTTYIANILRIKTLLYKSSDFKLEYEDKNLKLIEIVKKLDGDTYLSGPKAKSYLDHLLFTKYGIGLEFFHYMSQPNLYPKNILSDNLSIIDLLISHGNKAHLYVK